MRLLLTQNNSVPRFSDDDGGIGQTGCSLSTYCPQAPNQARVKHMRIIMPDGSSSRTGEAHSTRRQHEGAVVMAKRGEVWPSIRVFHGREEKAKQLERRFSCKTM